MDDQSVSAATLQRQRTTSSASSSSSSQHYDQPHQHQHQHNHHSQDQKQQQQGRPSRPLAEITNTPNSVPSWLHQLPPGPKQTPTQSIRKKHRSVRSLTREYEGQSVPPAAQAATVAVPTPATSPLLAAYEVTTPTQSPLKQIHHSHPYSSPVSSGSPLHRQIPVTIMPSPQPQNASLPDYAVASESARTGTLPMSPPSSSRLYENRAMPSSAAQGFLSPNAFSSPLGRSRSQGHQYMASRELIDDKPRAVSGSVLQQYDDGDENLDQVGDLGRSQSVRKPLSQMTAAERREHSRKHSRVHSRNLSVFFPQPGTAAEEEFDRHRVQMIYGAQQDARPHISVDTTPTKSKQAWPDGDSLTPSPTQSRRGHHSKHSVSYGMHSPAVSLMRDLSQDKFSTPVWNTDMPLRPNDAANAHSHHHHHGDDHKHDHTKHRHKDDDDVAAHQHSIFAGTPYPLCLLASIPPVPTTLAPPFLFSLSHIALGAWLWVSGQAADSLSVTGLGYLVIFDALGIFNEVLAGWIGSTRAQKTRKRISSAYSTHRVTTLLNFTQTIFLLFAAVYVCKESIEHALLESGSTSDPSAAAVADLGGPAGTASITTGAGASGHRHHDEEATGAGVELPALALIAATFACLFSNLFLGNHAKLVAASGTSTTSTPSASVSRRHSRSQSVLVSTTQLAGPLISLLSNPFSLMVLFFSTTLLFSAITMSPFQVAALDKVLAGLESVTMWYVALPASRVLGKVLLQTAPNVRNDDDGGRAQAIQLDRALKALQENALISSIDAPLIWQLTPSTSATASRPHSHASLLLSSTSLSSSNSRVAKSPSLIASIRIILKKEATDQDVLLITQRAYERCAPSVGAGMGVEAGEGLRGSMVAGELSVEVRREGEVDEQSAHDHDHHDHHHHDHGHNHGHEHEHEHSHNNNHNHNHNHAHAHDHAHHSHSHHDHDHDHDHDHAHAHAHSHGGGEAHSHSHSHNHEHGHHEHAHTDAHAHQHDQHHHHHHHHH